MSKQLIDHQNIDQKKFKNDIVTINANSFVEHTFMQKNTNTWYSANETSMVNFHI